MQIDIILAILEVPQSEKDENPEFEDDIDNCVKQKNLIPDALNATISRVKNHITISVGYDGKYDYYEVNYKGQTCYFVQGLIDLINRTTEDAVRQCDKFVIFVV